MAKKDTVANQQLIQNIELAYEGYDPTWIIGTHNDPLPHWSYGPYAAAAEAGGYRMRVNQSQSYPVDSNRGFFSYHNPYRATAVPTIVTKVPPATRPPVAVVPKPSSGPAVIVPVPGPAVIAPVRGPVVKAAKVVPAPAVTTIVYPHGQGHNLGTGHGYKNIVIMRIPDCCDGCHEKWKDNLLEIPGFRGVNMERGHPRQTVRATVFGDMDTHAVVKAIQKVHPRAEFWGGAALR